MAPKLSKVDFLIEVDSTNGIGVAQSEAYEVVNGSSECGSCRISLNSSLKTKYIGTLASDHCPTALKASVKPGRQVRGRGGGGEERSKSLPREGRKEGDREGGEQHPLATGLWQQYVE